MLVLVENAAEAIASSYVEEGRPGSRLSRSTHPTSQPAADGATDTLDAQAAARVVLSGRASGSAKTGDGPAEMLRMLKLAKDSAVKARSQTINQLKAVLMAADPTLREALSGLTNTMFIRRCAQLPATTPADVTSAAVYTLRLLARRILELTKEICDLVRHITDTITRHCPTLLTRRGVGPDNTAALLITAGDSPDRLPQRDLLRRPMRGQPLEASSAKTSRRRLNRGGDRQANCALYRIIICRLRSDTRTRNYLTRRNTEGKTRREAIRCLKRHLAREIYQIITCPPEAEPSAA